MASNKTEETVLVTLKQKGAKATVTAITGVKSAIEDTELSAIGLSETLDQIFDIKSLAAFENKVASISKGLKNISGVSMLGDSKELLSLLDDIADSTAHSANFTSEMKSHLASIAHDSEILRQNSDETADDLKDSARYSDTIADETTRTRKETEKLNRAGAAYVKTQKKSEGLSGAMANNTRNHGKSMSKLLSNAGGLTAAYAVVAANVYAITQSFRLLAEAASDARLLELSTALSASVGENAKQVATTMRESLGYAVSMQEAMRITSASLTKGFSSTQIEQLTKVAQRASVVLGVDMTDAMNRVTKGIAKQEVELLDELGISIKLTEAFEAYARTIGSTADDLSSYQRQQALVNLVTTKSTELFGALDSQLKATEWETFAGRASTAMNKVLQSLSGPDALLTAMLSKINSGLAGDPIEEAGSIALTKTIESYDILEDALKRNDKLATLKSANALKNLSAQKDLEAAIGAQRAKLESLNIDPDSPGTYGWLKEKERDKLRELEKELVVVNDLMMRGMAKAYGHVSGTVIPELIDAYSSLEASQKTVKDAMQSGLDVISPRVSRPIDKTIKELAEVEKQIAKIQALGGGGAQQEATLQKTLSATGIGKDNLGLQANIDRLKDFKVRFIAVRDAMINASEVQLKNARLLAEDNASEIKTKSAAIIAEMKANAALYKSKQSFFKDEKSAREAEREYLLTRIKQRNKLNALAITEASEARSVAEANLSITSREYTSVQLLERKLQIIRDEKAALDGLVLSEEARAAKVREITAAEKAILDAKLAQQAQAETGVMGITGGTIASGTDQTGVEQEASLTASGLQAGADALSSLTGQVDGLDAMASGLSNLAMVAGSFGSSMQSNMSMAVSGLQAVGGMLAMASSGAVSEIEHQIAMEQKRDGESEKSLAKIKALEAKKIKEQQKAAQQQILISTAVGVAMSLASGPFPYNIVAAGITAAAGALAYAQASSAASNQLAELNAESDAESVSSISIGERDNAINVTKAATAGESEYLTGAMGVGAAQDFTPRATGTGSSGNTNFLVGEFGPELVSLPQDTTIASNEELASSATGSRGPNLEYNISISTMDSQSFLDRSADIFEAFEHEANQQGMRVDTLRN